MSIHAIVFQIMVVMCICVSRVSVAQSTAAELIELEFEELVSMEVEIESAGKSKSRAIDLPYAAFVISADDIRRSGAQNIPEALRMAPGLAVEQVSVSEWSLAIRGAGGRFSRFVLVLVNGRSAYNSMFSGVNWDELNIVLSDIARIEIIRGPNAAAWGANAVNGIVNIITHKPSGTRSQTAEVWGGDHYRSGIRFQTSAVIANDLYMSFSGRQSRASGLTSTTGITEDDREDWRLSFALQNDTEDRSVEFRFDAYETQQAPYWRSITLSPVGDRNVENTEDKRGYITQINVTQSFGSDWSWLLRASAEDVDSDIRLFQWHTNNYQIDTELQGVVGIHHLSMGINTQWSDSRFESDPDFGSRVDPEEETVEYYGAYLGDSVFLLNEKLIVTAAARYDSNTLTDSEFQPSLRLIWKNSDTERVWFAASRAASIPSRAIVDTAQTLAEIVPAPAPFAPLPIVFDLNRFEGNKNTRLRALELGYRKKWADYSVDIAVFDFQYSNDIAATPVGDPIVLPSLSQPEYLLQEGTYFTTDEFDSNGFEISARGQPHARWNVQLAFSYLDIEEESDGSEHIFSLVSQHGFLARWTLGWWLRYNSGYISDLDAFWQLDIHATWDISQQLSLSLTAKNLFDGPYLERSREFFSNLSFEVEENYLATVKWTF